MKFADFCNIFTRRFPNTIFSETVIGSRDASQVSTEPLLITEDIQRINHTLLEADGIPLVTGLLQFGTPENSTIIEQYCPNVSKITVWRQLQEIPLPLLEP